MDQRTSGASALLTIGELATFAGVTVRAVRHYHARGLLPEPIRDASGYRRYDGRAVIDLIRIKTLAGAGVPLARVAELLEADPEEFSAALDEIDRRLEREVAEIQDHRRRIGELLDGESIGLPYEVVELLERMRQLGLSERNIEMERHGWLMIAAHSPDAIPAMVTGKLSTLDDPDVRELYRAFDRSASWEADDPRLEGVADMLVAILERDERYGRAAPQADIDFEFDPTLMDFLDSQAMTAVPAFRRLRVLLEARGWSGWTNFTRESPE